MDEFSTPTNYLSAALCVETANPERSSKLFCVPDYDLDSTLDCGQAFRWQRRPDGWVGIIGPHWIKLSPHPDGLMAECAYPIAHWSWLTDYLQTSVNLADVLATLPKDEHTQSSIHACHGLRLLRQEPWECLASFILSSTKQITQIRQMVGLLCERYGDPVTTPRGEPPAFTFPTARQIAATSEADLRACKLGFRAPYLLDSARRIADGYCDLSILPSLPLDHARAILMDLPGVGEKIANCVLLFSCGFSEAFPVDVWVQRTLRRFYFRGRRVPASRLRRFITSHFGINAGYAQQYLFHHARLVARKSPDEKVPSR